MTPPAQGRIQKPAQDTFCVIPWMHQLVDEQGFSKLCSIGDGDENYLRDANGNRLNLSHQLTGEQVLNSPSVKSARVKMMEGQWPKACERCRKVEELGVPSVRKRWNEQFGRGRSAEWLADTASDGTLGHPAVHYVDIRLGNACNLTCRMCWPPASRLWNKFFQSVQPEANKMWVSDFIVMGQHNWVKEQSPETLIAERLDQIEAIHFAGGEPLIIPEMIKVLELCIASGRAGEIALSYNTNLTVLPDKVTSLWKHFKSTFLFCSVDGFGSVTEYIRRPSKWADIDRNVRKLDANFDEWNLSGAMLTVTVQIYNILNLCDLFKYLRTAGLKRFSILPQLVPLFDPKYLSIQALPTAAKKRARRRLMRELERPEARAHRDYEFLAGCIIATLTYMDEADTTRELSDFLEFSENSDTTFRESWRKSVPELARAIDHYHQGLRWPILASLGLR